MWVRVGLIAALAALSGFAARITAQTNDEPRLIQSSDLSYLGAFRVPGPAANGVDFTYGGGPVAFNPTNNSLFVGNSNYIAEISIPTPVNTSDVQAMARATYVQPSFIEATEGHLREMSGSDVFIGGLLAYGSRLYGSATIYYDSGNSQRVSHFARSLNLGQPSFSGWSQVWDATHQGYVSGWMSLVPSEWQARLGGPAITGQCCIPIVWRTSFGPSAFAFDPAQIGQPTVAATPLLYYPAEHETLGPWEGANAYYGATARIGGVAIIAGTRTALFVGSNGLGTFCYGPGTYDQSQVGRTPPEGGEAYCYDPTDPSKGQHAYPYRYQVWAYDLNDLAAVKAGSKQPWEVVPYAVWPLTLPTSAQHVLIGGVGYDAQRQILYVSQRDGDQGMFASSPLIHAFRINAAPGAATAPSTSLVSGISLTADRTSPQPAATPITLTAQPTGGTAPFLYKWLVSDGTTSSVAANWSASNQFTWTPAAASPNYRVIAWVRSAGDATDAPEATSAMPFVISGSGSTATVALTADRVAPQPPLTPITFTATPAGNVASYQYKWLVSDGATTAVAANWSGTNMFTWTPSTANANYRVTVWVRSIGSSADAAEAMNSAGFAIGSAAQAPTGPTTPVSYIGMAPNLAAPQGAGTLITWTTAASGGTAPLLYKWWVSDGAGNYSVAVDWSQSPTFNWTPAVANGNYHVAVWVKSAGNPADKPEAANDQGFAITAGSSTPPATTAPPATTTPPVTTPPPATTPPAAPSGPITWVGIVSGMPSGIPTNVPVTFTAETVGGAAPLQYLWWTYDNGQWSPVGIWSPTNTLNWSRPGVGTYQIAVWVRSAGSTSDRAEADATITVKVQ